MPFRTIPPCFHQPTPGYGPRHPHVKQIEFRRAADHSPVLTFLKRLDHSSKERVNEYLVILLHCFGIHPAVPGNIGVIGQFSMGISPGIKKSGLPSRKFHGQSPLNFLHLWISLLIGLAFQDYIPKQQKNKMKKVARMLRIPSH